MMPDGPADLSPEVISERAVLGTAIGSAAGATAAVAALRPEHFRRNEHRLVFEAVERLVNAGTEAGGPGEWPAAVMTELARTGTLAKVGTSDLGSGANYLHSLMQQGGSVTFHAPVIITAARNRGMTTALESAAYLNTDTALPPDVRFERIRQLIENAAGWSEPAVLRPNADTVDEVLEAIEAGGDPGISTGFPDLDDAIGGLRPEELIVIGARPACGKTLCGLSIADYVGSRLHLPVLFISAEMAEKELTMRRISSASRVPLHHLVRGQVSDTEWDMISRAHAGLTDTRLYIDDTTSPSLGHIRGRLRAMERKGEPARLLVIDYAGYLQMPKAENRREAMSEVFRGVKAIAREFGIPVILLAQLNRGPEQRNDKLPTMADLRESGEAEQSADIVILLHRDDAHNPESPRAGEIDLIIDKSRQGPCCTVTLCFQGHYGRVTSLAAAEWSPSAAAERQAA